MENLPARRNYSGAIVFDNALLVCFYWGGKCCARRGKTVVLGCAIAYVVNIPMRFLECHVEPKCKKETAKKMCRPVCMVLAFLCIFFIAVLIV